MSALRFKTGELAIIAVDSCGMNVLGAIVEVLHVGPMQIIQLGGRQLTIDYETTFPPGHGPEPGGEHFYCHDFELRKIDPPAEPRCLTREIAIEVTP